MCEEQVERQDEEQDEEQDDTPLENIVLIIEKDGNLVAVLDSEHDYTEEQMTMFARVYLLRNPSFVLYLVILIELWIHEMSALAAEKWEQSTILYLSFKKWTIRKWRKLEWEYGKLDKRFRLSHKMGKLRDKAQRLLDSLFSK